MAGSFGSSRRVAAEFRLHQMPARLESKVSGDTTANSVTAVAYRTILACVEFAIARWDTATGLGGPLLPEVWMTYARSSRPGSVGSGPVLCRAVAERAAGSSRTT